MNWKRHKQTSTRATWYEAGTCMVQMSRNGWYECWVDGALIGECGGLGGAKNMCEMREGQK